MKLRKLIVPLSILSISIPTCGVTCLPVAAETKQTDSAKTAVEKAGDTKTDSSGAKKTATDNKTDNGFTGEKKENGVVCYYENGKKFTGERTIDKAVYYYKNGLKYTGDLKVDGVSYYYEDGLRYTGDKTINKVKYYFTDGLKTDIYIKVEGVDVHVPIKGNKWVNVKGAWHFVKNTEVIKGWYRLTKNDGEKTEHWSYFDKKTGRIYTNWRKMGRTEGEKTEHWSYFGANGWLRTGWVQLGKGTSDPDGNVAKHWSYFGGNGWLRTGWVQLGKGTGEPDGNSAKHWSYFGPNGWLRTGWQRMGTASNPDGKNKAHWSYFGGNGWLATSTAKANGMTLYFTSTGWLNKYETLTPHYSQYKYGLYTGCGGTNLLMALQYKGHLKDWNLTKFMGTMPYTKDGNPNNGFVGSPKTFLVSDKNRCIYPKALAKWGSRYGKVEDISGKDLNAVADEVRNGNPVLILATYNLKAFPVNKYSWGLFRPLNHHFFLLVGYDYNTDKYKVMDPLLTSGNGSKWVNGSQLRYVYNQIKGAVVVRG